ncbi:MAG: hypothetical protein QW520_01115 [Methanomassiliicoccales archaeon]
MELSLERKKQLEEIVDKMNTEAEMALFYPEGTPEHDRHLRTLLAYKEKIQKMEEHERTFVESGLIDRRDIHDFYWPELEAQSPDVKGKRARLYSEGKIDSDEHYRIDGVR